MMKWIKGDAGRRPDPREKVSISPLSLFNIYDKTFLHFLDTLRL
jgi:hypothetical protein